MPSRRACIEEKMSEVLEKLENIDKRHLGPFAEYMSIDDETEIKEQFKQWLVETETQSDEKLDLNQLLDDLQIAVDNLEAAFKDTETAAKPLIKQILDHHFRQGFFNGKRDNNCLAHLAGLGKLYTSYDNQSDTKKFELKTYTLFHISNYAFECLGTNISDELYARQKEVAEHVRDVYERLNYFKNSYIEIKDQFDSNNTSNKSSEFCSIL